jgi:hypothetical protein
MIEAFAQFAAERSARLESFDAEIRAIVEKALGNYGQTGWYDDIVEAAGVLWSEIFERESPTGNPEAALQTFLRELADSLAKTSEPSDPPTEGEINRVVNWVGVYSVNSATYFAARDAEDVTKTWITMHDDAVRSIHRAVDGQSVPILGTFDVGGSQLHFPGEPVGPPEVWINCRCLLATTGGPEMATKIENFAVDVEERPVVAPDPEDERDLTDEELLLPLVDDDTETPWHGVLVIEGSATGDKRQFDVGSLSYRNLPLPIKFQRASAEGHAGDVVVGAIDEIWKEEGSNEHRARGRFNLNVPEAHEVIDGLVFGSLGGVSVDVDSAEFYLEYDETTDEQDDDNPFELMFGGNVKLTHFTQGRISGASIVSIPAFQEAYVALGPDFEDDLRDPEAGVGDVDGEDAADTELPKDVEAAIDALIEALDVGDMALVASAYDSFRDFPAKERKESAGKGHALPDGSFPIENVEDLKNAIQAIGRAKDPAKAKAHIKRRASALGRADLIPEDWSTEDVLLAAAFAPGTRDGPGWITHPRATQRLRTYWTRGKGAAKIRWGMPGDFNRCRKQLGKYVNPAFLAGTCANMHKDAIKLWPGQEGGRRGRHSVESAPAFTLVASAAAVTDEYTYFAPEQMDRPMPLTVDVDGHVYGHLAIWGTCHLGIGERCVMPPHSESDYAYYANGQVLTDEGFVNTGRIILGTGHAGVMMSRDAAARHYDDTGRAVADITIYEDGIGIAYSGKVRDDASVEDIKALRASALSGDWRRMGSGLELIAVLAVNANGYESPRVSFGMENGEQLSLIASAGALAPRKATVSTIGKVSITAGAYIDDADTLLAIGRVVADELEYRQERKERLGSVRDPELLAEAQNRRAARLAAARSLQE